MIIAGESFRPLRYFFRGFTMNHAYTISDAFVTKCQELGMISDEFSRVYKFKMIAGDLTLTCIHTDNPFDEITIEIIKGSARIHKGSFYLKSTNDFHFFSGCLEMQIGKIKRGIAIY
jgi:hypothetical protein